jgi:1,4-alpha-glucan branching enzyme
MARPGVDVVDAPLMWAEGLIHGLHKGTVPLVLLAHGWADMLLETQSYAGKVEQGELKVVSFLEMLAARKADRVIANSRFTASKLVNRLHVRPERIALVYEYVEMEKFNAASPNQIREQFGIGEHPLILCAGYLQARKGVHILGAAMSTITQHVPGTKLVVIGKDTDSAPTGGSFKAYLQAIAKRLGWQDYLIMPGFVPDVLRSNLFSACDVFVFPSLYEPFGKPVLEAMVCNRPVVATATGIAAELRGLSPMLEVIAPGDPKTLARAVVGILSIPKEERERLAASHRQIVEERFSFERMVDQTLGVYAEAIYKQARK